MEQLSEQGIQQKINTLYNLSDIDLLEQAREMCGDFMAWLKDNFELTPEQETYFDTVPETVSFGWGAQFSALIITRGIIDLNISTPPDTRRTKQIRANTQVDFLFEPGKPTLLSGSSSLSAVYVD